VRGEVIFFAENDAQPAPCGVARDAGAVDAAADDKQVAFVVGLAVFHPDLAQ
jgi:hypothetical protein